MAADSELAERAFQELGSDPLYQQLCRAQKCYRARLTPKPWRCGIHRKPERWPWLDAKQEQKFQKWDVEYQKQAGAWATCKFLRQIGDPTIHPEVQAILRLHDVPTRAESMLELA